ncbi:5871_t:CDS:2 [Funneliformis geosporum]|nr:5871_t:CDS:2 [Funneliformis geosporum]
MSNENSQSAELSEQPQTPILIKNPGGSSIMCCLGEDQISLQVHLAKYYENDVSSKKQNFQTVFISKIKVIDRAWLKTFVACGLPFSAIVNPFFIDAIKSLRASYNPSSRGCLSGTLLDREVISINSKVNNILSKVIILC